MGRVACPRSVRRPSRVGTRHSQVLRSALPLHPVPRSWLLSRRQSSGDVQDSNLRPSHVMRAEGSGQVPGRLRRCLRAAQSVMFRSSAPGAVWRRGWAISRWISASFTLAKACVGCNGLVNRGDHRLTIDRVTLSAAHMGTLWGMGTDSASRSFRGAGSRPGRRRPMQRPSEALKCPRHRRPTAKRSGGEVGGSALCLSPGLGRGPGYLEGSHEARTERNADPERSINVRGQRPPCPINRYRTIRSQAYRTGGWFLGSRTTSCTRQ